METTSRSQTENVAYRVEVTLSTGIAVHYDHAVSAEASEAKYRHLFPDAISIRATEV